MDNDIDHSWICLDSDPRLILEDENDNEIFTRYDAINRPIATRVFRAGQADSHVGRSDLRAGPGGRSERIPRRAVPAGHRHDQAGLPVRRPVARPRATDNNDPLPPNDDSIVTCAYDSLSRQIEETQQIGGAARSRSIRAGGPRTCAPS